jgi:serine protease Do
MKQNWLRNAGMLAAFALLAPVTLFAQKDEKVEKEVKEKKDMQQIIITKKGDKGEKIVVEIDGDKVLINGKPLEEYKDKNGDIKVNVHSMKDWESLAFKTPRGGWNMSQGDGLTFFSGDENRAMLGVTTEKVADGASIESVTKGSAAEKAGLKENDIITKVGKTKIVEPDDLSKAIKEHKPGDKVDITYLRDKKEQKVNVELTKWKGIGSFSLDKKFDMNIQPRVFSAPDVKVPFDQYRTYYSGGSPKLGLSVQDSDDGKGVVVVNVDEESNAAKAGIKKDDVITHMDDKAVTSVDEVSKMLKEKKDNPTVRFQLNRGGKSQNIEVKMPRKIKTANL